jgi:adenylyl- and sulfurtransferase ThiI
MKWISEPVIDHALKGLRVNLAFHSPNCNPVIRAILRFLEMSNVMYRRVMVRIGRRAQERRLSIIVNHSNLADYDRQALRKKAAPSFDSSEISWGREKARMNV